MRRNIWLNLIGVALFAASSSCCEQQWNHSVRRMWCDYNTFRAPSLSFEQVDHLPYPAAQVGYYRWMYDKDPGHQLAALGPVTPPTCVVPQCVPPGEAPFAYQVPFPNAIPSQTDPLWGDRLPEPVNVSHSQLPDAPNGGKSSGKELPSGMLTVPMAPILPPTGSDPKRIDPGQPPVRPGKTEEALPGSPGPSFEASPPPPQPVEEEVSPLLGPASRENPNLRLTTGQPAGKPSTESETGSIWPR
jgi:hypothetical protein